MLIEEIYQKYKVEQKGSDDINLNGGAEEIKIGKMKKKKKCC